MSKQAAEVTDAAERTIQLAEKFAKAVAPNEVIAEHDHDDTKSVFASIPDIIRSSNNENLIENLNFIIEQVNIPTLEHEIASRGSLILNIQALELVTSIRKLQSAARVAGYYDPDVPNLDLKSDVSQEFARLVLKDLNDVKAAVNRLDNRVNRDGKSGISIPIGPLSVDITVLINMVRDNTEDAFDYISANTRVSVELLQKKLKAVNQTSNKILEAVKQKVSSFGSRIVELSSTLARAAAHSYMTGLELISRSISSDHHNTSASTDESSKDYELISTKAPNYSVSTTKLSRAIEDLIKGYKSGDFGMPGRQKLSGQLITVKFYKGNSGVHAALIITSRSRGTYRLTLPITAKQFDFLNSGGSDLLNIAAYKAFEKIKDEN